jgi:hypothetical protein
METSSDAVAPAAVAPAAVAPAAVAPAAVAPAAVAPDAAAVAPDAAAVAPATIEGMVRPKSTIKTDIEAKMLECKRCREELKELDNELNREYIMNPIAFINSEGKKFAPYKEDLFRFIVDNPTMSLKDLLKCYMVSETGNSIPAATSIFETLWCFAFYCNLIPNDMPRFPEGWHIELLNPDNPRHDIINDEYFKNKILHTTKGSKADIMMRVSGSRMLVNTSDICDPEYKNDTIKETDVFYKFVSVKYRKEKEKNLVKHYDITDIVSEFKLDNLDHKFNDTNSDIILCVNNSTELRSALSRIESVDMRRRIANNPGNIIGTNELEELYDKIRECCKEFLDTGIRDKIVDTTPPKKLRLHQEFFINNTITHIQQKRIKINSLFKTRMKEMGVDTGGTYAKDEKGFDNIFTNQILWGAVARSGKTLTSVRFIERYVSKIVPTLRNKKIPNIVILTPFPTETMGQWYSEVNGNKEADGLYNVYKGRIFCSNPKLCKIRGKIDIDEIFNGEPFVIIMSTQKAAIDDKTGLVDCDRSERIQDDDRNTGMKRLEETFITRMESSKNGAKNPFTPDIIIMDEAHHGYFPSNTSRKKKKTGGKYDYLIDTLKMPFQIQIYLSATYGKVQMLRNPKIITWSYEDQIMMRDIGRMDSDEFVSKFQEIKETIKNRFGYTDDDTYMSEYEVNPDVLQSLLQKSYGNIPDLKVIGGYFKYPNETNTSLIHNTELYKQLWEVSPDGTFMKSEELLYLLRQICDDHEYEGRDKPLLHKTVFSHIENIQSTYGADTRFSLQYTTQVGLRKPITQVWFLPCGSMSSYKKNVRDNIYDRIVALIYIMFKSHSGFRKNYNVLSLNHSGKTNHSLVNKVVELLNTKDEESKQKFRSEIEESVYVQIPGESIPDTIKRCEKDAYGKCEHKMLIILTGQRATTGVTIRCADIIGLFNTETSYDQTFQKIFRCLTDRKGKNAGYVIDPNPQRVQRAVYDSIVHSRDHNPNKTKEYDEEKEFSTIQRLCPINSYGLTFDVLERNETIAINEMIEKEMKIFAEETAYISQLNIPDDVIDSLMDYIKIDKKSGNMSFIRKRLSEGREPPTAGAAGAAAAAAGAAAAAAGAAAAGAAAAGAADDAVADDVVADDVVADDAVAVDAAADDVQRRRMITRELGKLFIYIRFCILYEFKHYKWRTDQDTIYKRLKSRLFYKAINDNYINNSLPKYIINGEEVYKIIARSILANESSFYADLDKIPKGLDMPKKGKLLESNPDANIGDGSDLFDDCYDLLTTPNKKDGSLMEWFAKRLKPRKEQKDKHGEVFTPMSLVKEMLDHVPDEFWSNPDMKILDPAAGYGQFPVYAYCKLFIGLEKVFPDPKTRRNHIIQNMIYMVEYQPQSARIIGKVFGKEANVLTCSFIPGDYKRVFGEGKCVFKDGTDTFDLVMGNPPFNKDSTGTGGGGFWQKFITSGFNRIRDKTTGEVVIGEADFDITSILKPEGYILYIHPPGWKKPFGENRYSSGDIFELYKRNGSLLYLNNGCVKEKTFPPVDYYVFKKDVRLKTLIDDPILKKPFTYNLNTLFYLTNTLTPLSVSILNKIFSSSGKAYAFTRDQDFKPNKGNKKKKTYVHAHYFNPSINKYEFAYRDTEPKNYKDPKVVVTYNSPKESGKLYPFFYPGNIGTTANTMYYIPEKDDTPKDIVSYLSDPIITFIFKISQYSFGNNRKNEYKILNKIPFPTRKQSLATFYKLTKPEMDFIRHMTGTAGPSPTSRKTRRHKKRTKRRKTRRRRSRH